MNATSDVELCAHCLVPAGAGAYRGAVAGETHFFCCFGCYVAYRVHGEPGEEAEATLFLMRVGVGSFLSMNVMLLSLLLYGHVLANGDETLRRGIEVILAALATPAMVVLGVPLLKDAWTATRARRVTAETMIVTGAFAAYFYSIAGLLRGVDRVYFDTATMLLLLFTVGRFLDAIVRARAARDLSPLLEAERVTVRVVSASGETSKPAFEVQRGETIRVAPGERIPIDGVVVEGRSAVDEALLSGEALPVEKSAGQTVLAGTVSVDGQLLVRAEATGAATHWSAIARAVREALARKSNIQSQVDRVAAVFLPLVLVVAAGTAIYWSRSGSTWHATSAALATLVVACPCALGPAAYLASYLGIGLAAERGVLIRSSRTMLDLARITGIVFDKTGCLTRGEPAIEAVVSPGTPRPELVDRAAGLAAGSDHPLSRAIVSEAAGRGAVTLAREIRARPGLGLIGQSGRGTIALGSSKLFEELGWPIPPALDSRAPGALGGNQSVVYYGENGAVHGWIALADPIRSEASGVLSGLRQRGLEVSILSGDREGVVKRVAEALGIGRWQAEVSPERKLAETDRRVFGHSGVAMVGDGLNDAPALAGAVVGIALGTASQMTRASADIVAAGSDLRTLLWLVDLARAVRRKTRTNLLWAFAYNVVGIAIAAAGHLQPVLAALLMALSSLFVVLNSMTLRRFQRPVDGAEGGRAPSPRELRREASPVR